MPLPIWLATKTHVPELTKVKVNPETVHTVVLVVVITGVSPLLAVDVRVYGDCEVINVAGGAKVIVCVTFAMVIVLAIGVAAE